MYRVLFPGGRRLAVTLSYDDGVSSDARLISLMKKHGLRGTFNLNGGCMHGEGSMRGREYVYRMKPDEVREVYKGMEIAVHGYTHPFFEQLPRDRAVYEVTRDREALEELAGYPVRGMAYPYGTHNREVEDMLEQVGIVYSRTTRSTESFALPTRFITWDPTCHHSNPRLTELCDHFLHDENRYGSGRLFYLWGHSYEFGLNDNWNVIERFCETMGGREDVWYATNMEIYRYLTAQRQIETSMDGSMLYNPSATDVWFNRGGEALCVPAGQLVRV